MAWITASGIPAVDGLRALFLDRDGTLLDIAPPPDALVVPPGLVTPLRDGMSMVAKEFVAAQDPADPADPGVLVLSRFAGAAEEFSDALLVHPCAPDDIAEAMHAALEERQARHAALRRAVFEVTAARYRAVFVEAPAA
jgi:trehalose 6-phosphate synthase